MTLSVKPNSSHMWEGFAVSPLIATALAIVSMLVFYGLAPIENVAAASMAIAPLGYACELILGLPLYFLVQRKVALRAWHLLGLGSFSGSLLSLPMAFLMFPARGTSVAEGFAGLFVKLLPFGAVVGFTLWAVACRRSSA